MLFLPEFPWSDLHTLNLDWLLSVVANHERQLQDLEGNASPYDEAPLQDGVADPGNVNQFARGNHRHPTDTTRASVAALQAVQDTVPGPSNGMPRMDGTASPGMYVYYSRADHVHPSDTSKLDKTGGEITGDLTVNGVLDMTKRRCNAVLSSDGWYRLLRYDAPSSDAASGLLPFEIEFFIGRATNTTTNELHKVTLLAAQNYFRFNNEISLSQTFSIDKVRAMVSGSTMYVDIHYAGNSANVVYVDFSVHCWWEYARLFAPVAFESVDPSPVGETEYNTHSFIQNGANFTSDIYKNGQLIH